jgi:ABC-type glycerol-3-phosphate transport system permease component
MLNQFIVSIRGTRSTKGRPRRTAIPLYVMMGSSVKPLADVQGTFTWLPSQVTLKPFVDMWDTVPLARYFINSLVVSLAAPGVVAVAIFAFITAWGEVLFASVLTDENTRTLAVGLRAYASQSQVYWNQVMAASLVISAPVVLAFLALQRYLVQGLTAGAVKS